MHYCIGDVHGCYDEMIALLNKINSEDPEAQFIFVGDFPDRGPKVWETVLWAMDNITPNGKYQSVQGNHEQMIMQWYLEFCEWYKKPFRFASKPPRTGYDFFDVAKAHNILKPDLLEDIIMFFSSLPFQKEVKIHGRGGKIVNYMIVHAWYDYDEPADSEKQYITNIWERNLDGNLKNNNIIIHGHTPTASGLYALTAHSSPGMIVYRKNAINIDGGCVFNLRMPNCPCMLCAICLETLEEYYCADLEERILDPKALEQYRFAYLEDTNPYREDMLRRLR